MRILVAHIIAAILLLSATITSIRADSPASHEYAVKADYIYNLIKFVNWPTPTAVPAEGKNPATIICVYGDNPFTHHLDKLLERTAKGLPIKIRYIDNTKLLSSCHIVFIAKSIPQQAAVLKKMNKQQLLTVGEHKHFLANGGIIGLVADKNSVQLQINLTQAKKRGFEISGNLLEIAKIVK